MGFPINAWNRSHVGALPGNVDCLGRPNPFYVHALVPSKTSMTPETCWMSLLFTDIR